MKCFSLALALSFTLSTAFAHNHEEKNKVEEGHDVEHQHVTKDPNHPHDDAHHKDHDHKDHHPKHVDKDDEAKKKK